jgi:nucleotide-binding universal stress UspA family protein
MAVVCKPGWTKPSTILFASEIPANEKALAFAVAQAKEFHAGLILFHACDTQPESGHEARAARYFDSATAARTEKLQLEPLAERARAAGVTCEVVVQPGSPSEQILAFVQERAHHHTSHRHAVDRIVMGTHSPGPAGKLLVGPVAEAVLRSAPVPVFIVGPEVADGAARNFATRTILCATNLFESSVIVAGVAAELAMQHHARLILQHVIRPQERTELLAGRSLDQLEADMLALVPPALQGRVAIQTIVVPGDPTEELLHQCRAQQADLIVVGAEGASAFAAASRHGVVYKVLASASCPVLTLSPQVLAECGATSERKVRSAEEYMAGIF